MSVGRICVREVDLADINETVQVAAARMNSRMVGTLVVQDESKTPVGILTDRDIAIRLAAKGMDPRETTVGKVMTASPKTVSENTPIETAITAMRSGPFRRLPVVDDAGKLVGLLSLDDILDLLAEEFQAIGELLNRENPSSLGP